MVSKPTSEMSQARKSTSEKYVVVLRVVGTAVQSELPLYSKWCSSPPLSRHGPPQRSIDCRVTPQLVPPQQLRHPSKSGPALLRSPWARPPSAAVCQCPGHPRRRQQQQCPWRPVSLLSAGPALHALPGGTQSDGPADVRSTGRIHCSHAAHCFSLRHATHHDSRPVAPLRLHWASSSVFGASTGANQRSSLRSGHSQNRDRWQVNKSKDVLVVQANTVSY